MNKLQMYKVVKEVRDKYCKKCPKEICDLGHGSLKVFTDHYYSYFKEFGTEDEIIKERMDVTRKACYRSQRKLQIKYRKESAK